MEKKQTQDWLSINSCTIISCNVHDPVGQEIRDALYGNRIAFHLGLSCDLKEEHMAVLLSCGYQKEVIIVIRDNERIEFLINHAYIKRKD